MAAVRYVALLALVLWIGGMIGARLQEAALLADVCGVVLLVALVVLKLVGPAPRDFLPRFAIVVLMLALMLGWTAMAGVGARPPMVVTMISVALGLVLLSWYVRE